jgi:hypothetical protein
VAGCTGLLIGCSREGEGESVGSNSGGTGAEGGSTHESGGSGGEDSGAQHSGGRAAEHPATGGSTASGGANSGGANSGGGSSGDLNLPESNAPFDYQLGGGYSPSQGVSVVTRDREDVPEEGLYNICYVNGFQTQPQDNDWWLEEHADLVLHDENGDPVEDEDWGEYLLDTSSDEKQLALLEVVGPWIEGCKNAGFDAVEIDNLDTYSRSNERLTEDSNVAFMARLSALAHANGLAIGQKNSAELVPRALELGTDFAVAEECNHYDECADYKKHYGDRVFIIEYSKPDFDKGCRDFPELSIVLRDVNLNTPNSNSYVFDGC